MCPNLREREIVWSWVLHAKSPLTRHTCFPVSDHILWPWWIKLVPWLLNQTNIWPWGQPTNHHCGDVRIGDCRYSRVVCHRDVPLVETLIVLDLRIFLSCAFGWCFQQNNHQSHLCRIWDRSPHHCSPWSQCQSQIYRRGLREGQWSLSKPFTKTSQFELNRLAHIIGDGAGTAWSPEKWVLRVFSISETLKTPEKLSLAEKKNISKSF